LHVLFGGDRVTQEEQAEQIREQWLTPEELKELRRLRRGMATTKAGM